MSFTHLMQNTTTNIFIQAIDQQFDGLSLIQEKEYLTAEEETLSADCHNLNVKFFEEMDGEEFLEQHSTEGSEGAESRKDSIDGNTIRMYEYVNYERISARGIGALKENMLEKSLKEIKRLTLSKLIAVERYKMCMNVMKANK